MQALHANVVCKYLSYANVICMYAYYQYRTLERLGAEAGRERNSDKIKFHTGVLPIVANTHTPNTHDTRIQRRDEQV